jgi:anti-sigma-K factor RskA
MNPHGRTDAAQLRERLVDASIDRALFGGSVSIDELDAARELGFDLDAEQASFEELIAELAIDAAHDDREAMPAQVEARLRDVCRALHPAPAPATSRVIPIRTDEPRARTAQAPMDPRPASFGWLAAAACIALGAAGTALVLRLGVDDRASTATAATDVDAYLAAHPGTMRLRWSGTDDDHVVGAVGGEVCFDAESDDGILVIEGLAANDPSREQYQLWIFDAERDERFPVDGGVFDVPAASRAVIPVRARLPVARPVLFAVTIEKPGGAVVSDRRIALVAKP